MPPAPSPPCPRDPPRASPHHPPAHTPQSEFVVGVMGTSVTAGHDNYFNQSYPVRWGVLMEPAFTDTNVSLVVRNHAMGWNPIHPR